MNCQLQRYKVQEWLCLNCQMQRALGIDMTTPRSKSQQQIHSPSHQAKPIVQPQQPAPQPTQPAAAVQPKPLAQSQPTQRQQQQQQQHPQSQPYGQTQPYSQSQPYSQPQQYPQSQSQTYPSSQPGLQTQPHTSPGLQRHPGPGGPQNKTGSSQQGMRSDPYSHRGPGAPGAAGGPTGGPNQPGGPRIPHPGAVPLPGLAKAPSQPDLGRGSPMHQSMARHHDQTRSAGSSPAHRPQSQAPPPAQDGLTKLFGFGASLLNQASTLISVDPLPTTSTQPSPARGKVVFSNATPENRQQQQQGTPDGGCSSTGPNGGCSCTEPKGDCLCTQAKGGLLMHRAKWGLLMHRAKLGVLMHRTKWGLLMHRAKWGVLMHQAKWGVLMHRTKLEVIVHQAKWEVRKWVDHMGNLRSNNSRPCPINKECRNSSHPPIIKRGSKDSHNHKVYISKHLLICRKLCRSRSLWRPLCPLQNL
ncbi:unnamed protein product [Pleuronectes platessa]|uniref:Uncharacterized protein n=1 Tax=Pleuronectes platessa TaxID=8262 RepID=A0A9N7V9T2_PLEPL|nr:unnamed protein product [Pleuronectes platessa]